MRVPGTCGSLAVCGWVCGETRGTSNVATQPCSGVDSGASGWVGAAQGPVLVALGSHVGAATLGG